MTHNRKIALWLLAAFVFCCAANSARAQAPTTPIIIKSSPATPPKPIKTRFEVLNMTINSIQVRSLTDERQIRTFTYSAHIRDQMQALVVNGGYQYGDKVVIHYVRGSDVALNIKGKPSKPI